MTLEEGYAECTKLARSHYENFPVGLLVPKKKQHHVHAVYAFARVADDIADEGYADPREKTPSAKAPTEEERSESMNRYREELAKCFEGKDLDPTFAWIFQPLRATAEKCKLPHDLFFDLLSAFQQDIVKRRYKDFHEVLDYCHRSADPIGRLVLHLHDIREESLHRLSDSICTALQLANFWQDVSVDLGKDRIYIPEEDFSRFHLQEGSLFEGKVTAEFINCMEFQVDRTQELFEKGRELIKHLAFKLAWEIRLTWMGGTQILEKIRNQNFDTLSNRPKLTGWDMSRMLLTSLVTR